MAESLNIEPVSARFDTRRFRTGRDRLLSRRALGESNFRLCYFISSALSRDTKPADFVFLAP
jgi:hypothetical protein